jgi:sulfatase maturation enzyme AslB (radical SAM superfamily)
VHTNSLEEIFNNPILSEIKSSLGKDISHKNCSTKCNILENYKPNSKYKFLRDLYNPMFFESDIDYKNPYDFKLSGIDLHWSSICDLKCVMCWHGQSSSIALEENKPVLHTSTEAADKIINLILDNQDNLKEIYLSGGEPTLIKHNLKLLKKLDKNKKFKIRINTNMMFKRNNAIIEELKNFNDVLFTVSVDGMNESFNYLRHGGDWDLLIKNLDNLQNTNFKWRINSVFFIPTVFTITDTLEFFIKNYNFDDFTINQLADYKNDSIRARNLPENLKPIAINKLTEFQERYKNNKNLYGQLSNCVKELENPIEEDFKPFFEAVDLKYKNNWKIIFGELL